MSGIRDLTALLDPAQGWLVTDANDINDAGQITGTACDPSFFCTAVRLDPVVRGHHGSSGQEG